MTDQGAEPNENEDREESGPSFLGCLFCLLLPLGIIADIADFFFYWAFLKEKGIPLLSLESIGQWEYLTTAPGIVLTTLGVAPWLLVLLWLLWPRGEGAYE